jgi:hypothetical protein
MKLLSGRTRLLFLLGSLAPLSILITRLELAAVIRRAQAEGAISAWVDPGPASYFFLFVGVTSLVAACVSLFFDIRGLKAGHPKAKNAGTN